MRQRWTSKWGVILAVAGSAVGLGNFLRFPGIAASNGGGAFMIPYLVSFFLLGLPLMWIEWTIGRFGGGFGHSTAPGMFDTMWQKNRFIKYFGVIGIFGPLVIFAYYTYIESWLLGYSWFALTGKYATCHSPEAMTAFLRGYQGFTPNPYFNGLGVAYLCFIITFAINILIVALGVSEGIERFCLWAMPLLFVIAVALVVRVLTLTPPAGAPADQTVLNGLGFLWNPDWGALKNPKVWLAAAGQIFFTLSVGFGVILTYASYLKPNDDVALSGLTAAVTNEFAEVVLGGSLVIPAAFVFVGAAGIQQITQQSIFDIGFITMPLVLGQMPAGQWMAFLWFFLLFLAGVTSSISLAQPAIAFLEDEFNLTRREAAAIFSLVAFLLAQPAIFFLGNGALDEMDFWATTVCLVVFGTIETILFGWVFGMDRAWTELHAGSDIQIPKMYRYVIKYITPVMLIAILTAWVIQDWKKQLFLHDVSPANKPIVLLTRLALIGLFLFLVLMVRIVWRRRAAGREER